MLVSTVAGAQPTAYSAGDIMQMLKKANTLGRVLYIAAHPDDENTRLITYLSKKENLEVAYLSLTRGDGGQNLVGTEQGELLGLLRTQELLEARKIDGGLQYFSRANDFGYSKTYNETLNIWDENEVLSDMVYVIRKFKPDVIITRFPPLSYEYKTHGHHEASAYLAEKAFDLAADAGAFPEQLKYVQTWKPVRLYWNTSTWFYRNTGTVLDTTGKIIVDVGSYIPELGVSCTEIAAESRSQHKSQGFGAAKTRGEELEYLEYVKGTQASRNLFDGIDITWSRVKGSQKAAQLLKAAADQFDIKQQTLILPSLLEAYTLLKGKNDHWSLSKADEVKNIIAAVCGMFFESAAADFSATPGGTVKVTAFALKRSSTNVTLKSIQFAAGEKVQVDSALIFNKAITREQAITVPEGKDISQPYWLFEEQQNIGMYPVAHDTLGIQPENPPALETCFTVVVDGVELKYYKPVEYKWTDRVKGELYRPFIITPQVTIHPKQPVIIFADEKPKEISYVLKAWKDSISGKIEFGLPKEWKLQPESINIELMKKGEEKTISFALTPSASSIEFELRPFVLTAKGKTGLDFIEVAYDHIPVQSLFPAAKSKVVKLDLKKSGNQIGYIMGAGDEVTENLKQAGYNITLVDAGNISEKFLQQFDAVIVGIRAYNTETWLPNHKKELMDYVDQGGTLVVQYQTTGGLLSPDIGPYPFKIGRDRVTEENAAMNILNHDHPLFNVPNKITQKDFEGWVQERGLYFAQEWDENYLTPFSCADPSEDPVKGSLLFAQYGKGTFIYTGISFFRQLPAGVPGAYRLFANLIAGGNGAP